MAAVVSLSFMVTNNAPDILNTWFLICNDMVGLYGIDGKEFKLTAVHE